MKAGLRFAILKRDNFKCLYCGATADDSVMHVDHLIPASCDGEDDPGNLVTACAECNTGKGAKFIESIPEHIAAALAKPIDFSSHYIQEKREGTKMAGYIFKTFREMNYIPRPYAAGLLRLKEDRLTGFEEFGHQLTFQESERIFKQWPELRVFDAGPRYSIPPLTSLSDL